MDASKRPTEQPSSPVFVEWEGHWYGVPFMLAHNMRKAGFAVRTKPPESAQPLNASKPKL
jgi:hypothetical protein